MKHDPNMTAAARAIVAAGQHLRKKDAGDLADTLVKKLGDLTDVTLKRIEAGEEKSAEMNDRLSDLEKRNAREKDIDTTPATWGKQFVDQQKVQIKSLAEDNKGRVGLTVKALSTDPASAGAMTIPHRDAPTLLPKQRLVVRDLLPVVSISSGSVEYVQQDTRPANAAAVAEGALKPESDMTLSLQNVSAKVIAHWMKASRQVLEDLPQLSDLIDSEMRYGLALAEEAQVLHGNGTGANLFGLVPNATPFADPLAMTNPTMLDTLGAAILQSALADFPATGIVMHPADWTRLRLLKDADGKYILGDPAAAVEPRLFGLPVVATKAIGLDQFLVGGFADAATLYDRWVPRVEVGYVNDDFTRNLVTILAEERVALAVKQKLALTYGFFTAG